MWTATFARRDGFELRGLPVVIYLFVKPRCGHRWPLVFGYQHHWPELRRLIWDPFHPPTPREEAQR